MNTKSGRVAQVCKPKIQEAEVGGLQLEASLRYSETLCQTNAA